MAKLSSKTTYIPNRYIQELMIAVKGTVKKFKGTDIVDGVYLKKNAVPKEAEKATGTPAKVVAAKVTPAKAVPASSILKQLLADKKLQADDKPSIKQADIDRLIAAGYTDKEIQAIYFGIDRLFKMKCDIETTPGILNLNSDSIPGAIDSFVEVAESNAYELGLEYPDFDWSKIIEKYGIKVESQIIENERTWGDGKVVYRFQVFTGNNVAIGQMIQSIRVVNGEEKKYDEINKLINYKTQTSYQKERDVRAGFNSNYWGIVSSDKNVILDIASMLFSQSGGYVKEVDMFSNNMSTFDGKLLDKNKIDYEMGGQTAHKKELRFDDGGDVAHNTYEVTGINSHNAEVVYTIYAANFEEATEDAFASLADDVEITCIKKV